MQVMKHIVDWFNTEPNDIIDQRDSNKPLLREDLIPPLEEVGRNNPSTFRRNRSFSLAALFSSQGDEDNVATRAGQCSIAIERPALDHAQSHRDKFKDPSANDDSSTAFIHEADDTLMSINALIMARVIC